MQLQFKVSTYALISNKTGLFKAYCILQISSATAVDWYNFGLKFKSMKVNLERASTTVAELWMDTGCLLGLREAAESAFWWQWRREMLQPVLGKIQSKE